MKVVIIEDEQLSAEHLQFLLERIDTSIEVIARFESVKKSIEAFQSDLVADLLFVDIHLADGLSFEIFSKVSIEIPVIFTTAFDEYALQAFQVNSIDYLLKPIDKMELSKSIEKFRKHSSNQTNELMKNLLNLSKSTAYKGRFMVKLGDTIVSIKSEEIHHFKAEVGLVLLVHQTGKRYPVDYTMDQLETILNPDSFFRINRKVFLQIDAVQKVGSFFNSRLKISTSFIDENDCVVSRERVVKFKEWLDK
jgi:DNA-binding LytR/AlgR family response regulator